jgi:hypothetical protein
VGDDIHRTTTVFADESLLVTSTVATALERALDKELHSELVQDSKTNAARIGQVCHDHSNAFLASVSQVVALGGPSARLTQQVFRTNALLQADTATPMLEAAALRELLGRAHFTIPCAVPWNVYTPVFGSIAPLLHQQYRSEEASQSPYCRDFSATLHFHHHQQS